MPFRLKQNFKHFYANKVNKRRSATTFRFICEALRDRILQFTNLLLMAKITLKWDWWLEIWSIQASLVKKTNTTIWVLRMINTSALVETNVAGEIGWIIIHQFFFTSWRPWNLQPTKQTTKEVYGAIKSEGLEFEKLSFIRVQSKGIW